MRTETTQHRVSIRRACLVTAIAMVLWSAGVLKAQSGTAKKDNRGWVLVETFQGSSDTLGTVSKLGTAVGYKFTRHFEIDAGAPFYFVHAASSSTATGYSSGNGIGNPYLNLQFSLDNSVTSFVSSISGTAPVADTAKGLSTGRVTVDWDNYLEFTIGRITPFANLGLGNSISDTHFFTRPFTSLGTVAHFEGGASVQVWRALSLGGSAYADAPFGQQKVFSKLIKRGQVGTSGQGRSPKSGAFEKQSMTVGDASIARDNGGSVWLDLSPGGVADFQVGFSRSVEYDLNTVFFGVVLNVGNWLRARH
ncbi:MAG TPA: hypothetical protein VE398_10460 [Acidobacteriota bacterium]|nr:hypothetical protein [Acidobacteriota bacterium]